MSNTFMRSKVSQAAGGNKALYPQLNGTFPEWEPVNKT